MSSYGMTKLNLHDVLRKHAYDHAVILTYEFSASFFEGYCLEKLKSLAHNANVSVILDQRVYDALLTESPGRRPEKANLRYLLHPVMLPGRFHPKLFLFASRKQGMLVVGSANFTRHGLTSNAELVEVMRFDAEEDTRNRAVFADAFLFIQEIAKRWGGADLHSNLLAITRDAAWLVPSDGEELPRTPVKLLHNLDEPLWPQIAPREARGIRSVRVLSRYFSPRSALLDRVHADLDPSELAIYTQNGVSNLEPSWLDHATVKAGRTRIFLCSYTDDDHPQSLHAKAYAFERASGTWDLAFGSANFTDAALLKTAADGNLEILLSVPGLPKRKGGPASLFDPDGTAVQLTDKDQLLTDRETDELPRSVSYLMQLDEASLDEDKLVLSVRGAAGSPLAAELRFYDDSRIVITLSAHQGRWEGALSDDVMARVQRRSTVVQVISATGAPLSNPALLLNLQDVRTGESVRKARHVREAIESAVSFCRVLNDLLNGGDDAALLSFLTLCDIPFCGSGRPPIILGGRPAWDQVGGLKQLAERNIRSFKHLHEAAVAFIQRHLKRLNRHAESPELESAANYMHIAVGVAGVVRAQVERALAGLESTTTPLTSDAWFEMRRELETYASLFSQLFQTTAEQYLPRLVKYYKPKKVRDAIQPEVAAIRDAFQSVLVMRSRLEACFKMGLRVQTPDGPLIPPLFPRDLLSDSSWAVYAGRLHEWEKTVVAFAA